MQSTGGTTDLVGNRVTQQTEDRDGNTVSSSHRGSQLERRLMPRFGGFLDVFNPARLTAVANPPSARFLFLNPPGLGFSEVLAK